MPPPYQEYTWGTSAYTSFRDSVRLPWEPLTVRTEPSSGRRSRSIPSLRPMAPAAIMGSYQHLLFQVGSNNRSRHPLHLSIGQRRAPRQTESLAGTTFGGGAMGKRLLVRCDHMDCKEERARLNPVRLLLSRDDMALCQLGLFVG